MVHKGGVKVVKKNEAQIKRHPFEMPFIYKG